MSKSKGNVVDPWTVINKYGADALRWYCFTSTPAGQRAPVLRDTLVAEVTRQFLLTLWNVYSFFVTYANIDKYVPDAARDRGGACRSLTAGFSPSLTSLCRTWIEQLEGYDPTERRPPHRGVRGRPFQLVRAAQPPALLEERKRYR